MSLTSGSKLKAPTSGANVHRDIDTYSTLDYTVTHKRSERIRFAPGPGTTLGKRIDALLEDAAHNNERIASVTITVSDEDWELIREMVKSSTEITTREQF